MPRSAWRGDRAGLSLLSLLLVRVGSSGLSWLGARREGGLALLPADRVQMLRLCCLWRGR